MRASNLTKSRQTNNKLNEPLSGKVFFAGELYDLHHQLGVPGAIVSGYHSIDKLLTKL